MKLSILRTALVAAAVLGLSFSAVEPISAANFPDRIALEAQSSRSGLGVDRLPLLERVAGPGREAVAQELLGRFAHSDAAITTAGTHRLDLDDVRYGVLGDNGWYLTVYGDGTRVRYSNEDFLEARPELAVLVEDRLPESILETLGRTFIAQHLQGLVRLGAGEELMPSFTEFLVQGGMSTKPGGPVLDDTVLASTVVFSRKVNGTAIVGPGSKIAITFANDGVPVAFAVDWAEYRTTSQVQEVIPVEDILDRSAALRGGTGEQTIEHIECGYFDLGGRSRDASAPLQAGCYLQISSRTYVKDGHLTAAFAEAVPAGATVLPDYSWPEALKFAGLPLPPPTAEPPSAPAGE